MPGYQRSACAVPSIARAAATAVVRKGEGVRLRPISSSTSAGLDRAEAEAALALGDADAGQAELGELLPQAVAEAVLAADVAPVAQLLGDRAFLGQEAAPPSPAASSGRR